MTDTLTDLIAHADRLARSIRRPTRRVLRGILAFKSERDPSDAEVEQLFLAVKAARTPAR